MTKGRGSSASEGGSPAFHLLPPSWPQPPQKLKALRIFFSPGLLEILAWKLKGAVVGVRSLRVVGGLAACGVVSTVIERTAHTR